MGLVIIDKNMRLYDNIKYIYDIHIFKCYKCIVFTY
jgi:hypothetical protein